MENLFCLNQIKCIYKGDFDSFKPLPQWNNVITEHLWEVKANAWNDNAAPQMRAIQSVQPLELREIKETVKLWADIWGLLMFAGESLNYKSHYLI